MADGHKPIEISLNKLHFDLANPRHDPTQDEAAALSMLVSKEKVVDLACHIAEHGASPLDVIAVIDLDGMPGHYTVLEGNRRLGALKLLQDPSRASSSTAQRTIKGLQRGRNVRRTISAIWFPSREAARPWLEVRHQGEQNGIGTVKWKASQKARFDAQGTAPSNPNRLALELIDYAKKRGLISEDDANRLAITTVTRYLGSPNVREALGLASHDTLMIDFEQSEVDGAIRRFLHDALPRDDGSKSPAHSRSNKADRTAYARSLRGVGASPQTRLVSPISPNPAASNASSKGRRARSSIHPEKRTRIVPAGWSLKNRDSALRRLFEELRSIDPDTHPYAANYLLRAFIERILVLFATKRKLAHPNGSDQLLISECAAELTRDGVGQSILKVMRTAASNKDAAHSLHTLGAAVHAGHVPDRKSLIKVWDNWQAALESMLARL